MDFCIPDTPNENISSNAHDEVDLSHLSPSSGPRYGSGLAVRQAPGHRNQSQQKQFNYFSSLTQKFQSNSGDFRAKESKHAPGNATGLQLRPVSSLEREAREKLSSQPQRGNNNNDAGSNFDMPGTVATKFNNLNEKIQSQAQEITELQFSLNDADVAAAALETEKRRLKHRNDDLEHKLLESQTKVAKLQEDTRQLQEKLQNATHEQEILRHKISSLSEKAKLDETRLADAQSEVQAVHTKLEVTRSEMQRDMDAAVAQSRANVEAANQKIKSLTLDVEHREAELQYQKETNSRLSKQLDEIPDRNFQALGACVKKVFEKLDRSQIEILTKNEVISEGQRNLIKQVETHIRDVLAASHKQEVSLSTFQEKIDLLKAIVSKSLATTEAGQAHTEKCIKEALSNGLQGLRRNIDEWQTEIQQKLDRECHSKAMLADTCRTRDEDSKSVSKALLEQTLALNEQLQLTRELHDRLQTMENAPREDPNTAALIQLLRVEKSVLETKVRDQEAQIRNLEAINKQKTDALVEAGDKFAREVQQLGVLYQQREEEYRRVQERVTELAQRETRLYLDESKQETQRELQQERAKRQELERHLRQAKEEVSVLEESYRRCGQSLDALQEELAVTRLRAQGVAEHLEEKVRAAEQERDADRTVITRLKALLADKEMDYGNLKNSMAVYDEKVGILMEHLRVWAQDYRHIGAIRARLEMLGQIDQSCAATARIREAEQIASVLAHLRQCCARGGRATAATQDEPVDHRGLRESQLLSSETSDDSTHEKRIAELSAFLDLDTGQAEQDACGAMLQTPSADVAPQTTQPPPVLHERRTRGRTLQRPQPGATTATSGSPQISSPVARRAQRAGVQKRRYADVEDNVQASTAERRRKRNQPVHDSTPTQHETDESGSPSVKIKSEEN